MPIRMPKTTKGKTRLAAGSAIVAVTIGFVGAWEGLRLSSYQDIVGVWTSCYGETAGMGPGMRFTKDQCDVMFLGSLQKHEAGMRSCLTNPDAIPDPSYVAFLSFTYNVGTGAFCKSTLARRINAGDLKGACDQLMRWTRAGGKVVKGLVNRRSDERALCLKGVG